METLLVVILIWRLCAVWGFDNNQQKQWLPNTNFYNPSNWNLQRVPCDKDRVIFPSGLQLGVTLPESGETILRELVLPRNGELFLPSNGVLQIGGDVPTASKCKGEDIQFARQVTESWFNPTNWQSIETVLTYGYANPTPHADRVPCKNDVVLFQQDNSFRIQLPQVSVKVGKINFGDHEMSNAEWSALLKSESGYRQFVGPDENRETSVTIQPLSSSSCQDKTGCVCQSVNKERILEQVCSFARCENVLPCYSPVKPYGHCCPICGSFLIVKYDNAFRMEDLQSMLDDYTKTEDYSNVLIYARKTAYSGNDIQIVLVEKNQYDGISRKLAAELNKDLIKDMNLGVRKVTVYSAGTAVLGSKLAQAARTVFGTFIAVCILLALIFYVSVVYRKGMPFGKASYQLFQFARFENVAGEEDVAIVNNLNSDAAIDHHEAGPSKAFDNPMYGTKSSSVEDEGTGFDSARAKKHTQVTHENPVYSELKRREEENRDGSLKVESDEDGDEDSTEGEDEDDAEQNEKLVEAEFQEISINKTD